MINNPILDERCADHCVGEACPETDCPVKPVEQGEQIGCTVDEEGCAVAICADIPAPSEPELNDYTEEGRKEADTWFAGADKNDRQVLFMEGKRLERENQQLRQRCEELAEKYKEVAELQLADEASVKNLQQQLAQKEQP